MYKKMPAGSLAELTDEEFKNFSDLIYRLSGIYLKDSKITLLSNRLRQCIAERKFGSFAEYYDYIRKGEDEGEINQMLNAVSTNETYFFRSDKHFDALRDRIMPELMKKIFRPIRIWCAGCSSGEEPYTIAMIMNEKNWLSRRLVEIYASDMNTDVLDEAKKCIYDVKRLRVTPDYYKEKYFKKYDDTNYEFDQKIASYVKFNRVNLLTDKFDETYDIIFCRNVMIYFDKPVQQKIVSKFYDAMTPGGYLMIGHSESLYFIESDFVYEKMNDAPIYYKPEK